MTSLPRLDLRLLRAAVAVRDAGSVTVAARRLGTSQPALSRLIATIEGELGFALFSRTGRTLKPAPAAELFLSQAAATLVGTERLGQLALTIRQGRLAKLKIAAPTNLFQEVLPGAVAHFAAARPGVEIEVQIRRRHEILQGLERGGIDFGIAVLPIGQPGLTVRPFAETEAVCLLPSDHSLAQRASITPADLSGLEQIGLPDGSILRGWVEDAFASAGVAYRRRFTVDSNHLASRLVAAGLGVAVIHPVAARDLPANVVSRPFRPALPFTYALLERADLSYGPLAQDLEDALRQAWPAHDDGLARPS